MRTRALLFVAVALIASIVAAPAGASQLIDRNATNVSLKIDADGVALLSYKIAGVTRNVVARGAVNAIAPTTARPQVKFELDYSGGYKFFRKSDFPKVFEGTCGKYDGPDLEWLIAACKAPDGSYWAAQSWQRQLPNVGLTPKPEQAVWELRLSHWKDELPVFTINLDWAYRRFEHIYGSLTYLGKAVHGFRSTSTGEPLDTFGRNIYLDTFDSAYGKGWRRENSFLAHRPNGNFCYGFYPNQNNSGRPPGNGTRYRATVIGPGVTPDVYWEAVSRGPYNRELDLVANEDQREFAPADRLCRPN